MSLGIGIGVSTVLMNSVLGIFVADLLQSLPTPVAFTRASSGSYTNNSAAEVIAGQNVPRFDYDPATKIPYALLIEEQRSNYFLNSDTPATQTATLASGTYTLRLRGTGSVAAAAGSAVGTGFGTATASAPVTFTVVTAGTVTFTVSGTVAFVQCENGRWPTSAIHTTGSVGTRAADNAVITDLNSIGFKAGDGTVIVEWADSYPAGSANFAGIFSLNDGSSNNKIAAVKLSSGDTVRVEITIGGTTTFLNTSNPMSFSGVNRLALRIKNGSYAASLNGGPVATVATAGVPTVSQLNLGRDLVRGYLNGHLRKFTYSSVAAADDQLIAATKPQNIAAPVVAVTSGSGYVGSVYSVVSPGLWVGQDGNSYGYQLLTDGVAVSGATSSSYTLPLAKEGAAISWQVTATNGAVTQTVASNAVEMFVPSDLTDPLLFSFDALTPSSLTYDGSNLVSQVSDLSGNAYNLTSSGALRPTYIANDGDGYPCISFTEGTQLKNVTNSASTAEDTFFLVMERVGPLNGTLDFIWSRAGNSGVTISANGLDWLVGAGNADTTTALRNADLPVQDKYIVLSGRRSAAIDRYFGGTGNTGVMELRENGATIKTVTHTAGATAGPMFMGRDNNGNTIVMKVRQGFMYKSYFTHEKRLQLEEYLRARWNVYPNFTGRRDLSNGTQRYVTANNVTSTAALPAPKSVGLMIGQSNNMGAASTATTALPTVLQNPIANGFIWNPTNSAFETLQVNVNNLPNSAPTAGQAVHGAELSLMYDLVQTFGPYYLVKSGQGGTGLKNRWMPNLQATNNLWRTAMDRFVTARNTIGKASGQELVLAFIFWFQGEQDAVEGGDSINSYGANEQYMFACTRSFLNAPNCKLIVPKVRDAVEPSTSYDAVTAAKVANAGIIVNYNILESWTGQSPLGGPHGDSPSMVVIGNNAAALMGATTSVS